MVGSFVSNVGGSLQLWTVFWLLDHLTRRPEAVGLVGLVRIVPLLALGLFGGLVADTRERPRVLRWTQSAMALVAVGLAVLAATDGATPLAIYVLIFLEACARAYNAPARQSIVANLVPREHFPNAAGINGVQWRLSEVIGPVLSGLLIAGLGPRWGTAAAFALNAVSFAGLLLALRRVPHLPARMPREPGLPAIRRGITEGIAYLRRTYVVRNAMWLDFWGTFVGGASALLPAFARADLRVGPTGYGVLTAATGAGAMLASLALAGSRTPRRPGRVVIGSIALFGAATIALGFAPNLAWAAFALAAVGASDMVSTVQRQTIRQLAVPDEMRGRLASIGQIFQVSGPQLGDWEAAEVAGAIGVRGSFVLGGAGAIVAAVWYRLRGPALRDYRMEAGTATEQA